MSIVKTIKKYKWWIIGGIAITVGYHLYMRKAFIGNDPNTGIALKDQFHLYAVCKDGQIMGRCVNPDGSSCTGDPCVSLGDLDKTFSRMNPNVMIMSPGGEMIIREPMGRPTGVGT